MSTIKQNTLYWSQRCYRALLRVYPREFHDEFEMLLCQGFGDLSQRALRSGGWFGWVRLWLRTLSDLVTSAIDHRLGNKSDRWFRFRWIAACGCGPLLGALLLFVDMHSVRLASAMMGFAQAWGFKRGDPLISIPLIASIVSLPLGWLQSRTFGWKVRARCAWIAATVLGVTAGWTVMFRIFSRTYLWTTIVTYRPFVLPAGFLICGSIIGLFQMVVLSGKTARPWVWVPACATAMLVLGYFNEIVPVFLPPIIGGAIFGIVTVGPLKWILQRGARQRALISGQG